jgi:spore coat protein CotH
MAVFRSASKDIATMKRLLAAAAAVTVVLGLGACGASTPASSSSLTSAGSAANAESAFYDSSTVHSISVAFEQADYEEMLQTYADTGDKEWIAATVVIDGVTYENAGIKLKGNSSLQGLSQALTSASGDDDAATQPRGGMGADLSPHEPGGLPWRIKLDEYVDGQSHDQNWYEENVDDNGVLFKAESGGDYSYRGDDYTAYTDAFDLEANPEDLGDEEAYQPLIAFLEFVNDADDETFAAELGDYLDIDSFADYLAIEELLGNTDDIDGPGNNSYLAYDPDTGLFTVIAWDHNLTLGSGMGGFGGAQGGGARPGGTPPDGAELPEGVELPDGATPPADGETPEGMTPPDGAQAPDGAARPDGGLGSQSNALAERFQGNAEFSALVDEASARLTSELIDSGYAAEALEEWTTVLLDQASDLVPAETIQSESDSVAQALSGA